MTTKQGKSKARKPGHQAARVVFRRKLIKSWEYTEQSQAAPDILVKQLFRLAIQDARQRKKKRGTAIFTHQYKGVNHKQRYRISGLGELVLIPPKNSSLAELSSCIFKI